ncbi:DUF2806 domain-containing protein [Sinorhizobium medicae]|nr:DUF2806 domain-containing protein [Sinorhizobium medicae]
MRKADDENVGLSVGWSWNGINAKIKSRYLSALDRFGARRIDEAGLDSERKIAAHSALTEAQLAIISAATEALTDKVRGDPELARRALQVFSKAERQTENVGACLTLALEDLRNRDEPISEANPGPEQLDNAILDRWEHYASGATTEQLRERWGRVLASEIRVPGTFNLKCLRIIDELEPDVAVLFERFCEQRVRDWVPECINTLKEYQIDALQDGNLVFHSEFGRTVGFEEVTSGDGTKIWFLQGGGPIAIGLRDNPSLPVGGVSAMLRNIGGGVNLPVYALTAAGRALASILPRQQHAGLKNLANAIQAASEPDSVYLYEWAGDRWVRSKFDGADV